MANRERGEYELTVGDRVYKLRLTMDAAAKMEEACSTKEREVFFPEILSKVLKGSSKHTLIYVWACLQEHHADIDLKATGELLNQVGGPLAVTVQVAGLMASTQPDAEDVSDRPQKAQAKTRGTGGSSTSRRARSA